MITPTVDIIEVLWTVCAIPGLWLWVHNHREAQRDASAAETITPRNGRYLWANFSVLLTRTFVGIEAVFIVMGIFSMIRPSSPNIDRSTSYLLAALLIVASVAISWLAYRWRYVNQEIVDAARVRQARPDRPDSDADNGDHELPPIL